MPEITWVKVATDMFDSSRKIKQIEAMPKGDTIIVIWLKLLLLAGDTNDGGAIYITPGVPYTVEGLSVELKRPVAIVKTALDIFQRFGMIQIIDGVIYLTGWEKHQNVDRLAEIREKNRLSQQRSRQKKKLSDDDNGGVTSLSRDSHMTCHDCHDIEKEEEKEEEEEKEFHSFIHSARARETELETARRKIMGGEIGKGVLMLSDDELADLFSRLSLAEFERYAVIVADCELSGKKYRKKTHYQAILEMALSDRKKELS